MNSELTHEAVSWALHAYLIITPGRRILVDDLKAVPDASPLGDFSSSVLHRPYHSVPPVSIDVTNVDLQNCAPWDAIDRVGTQLHGACGPHGVNGTCSSTAVLSSPLMECRA